MKHLNNLNKLNKEESEIKFTLAITYIIWTVITVILILAHFQEAHAHSQTPASINKVSARDSITLKTITVANLNRIPSKYDVVIDGIVAGQLQLKGNEFRKVAIELTKRVEDRYNETIKRQVCSISVPERAEAAFKTRICTNVNILWID